MRLDLYHFNVLNQVVAVLPSWSDKARQILPFYIDITVTLFCMAPRSVEVPESECFFLLTTSPVEILQIVNNWTAICTDPYLTHIMLVLVRVYSIFSTVKMYTVILYVVYLFVGTFLITLTQIKISIQSSAILLPVNLLIVQMFQLIQVQVKQVTPTLNKLRVSLPPKPPTKEAAEQQLLKVRAFNVYKELPTHWESFFYIN